MIVIVGVLLCLGQWGKTQDLKKRIAELKSEQAKLNDATKARDARETHRFKPPIDRIAQVNTLVRDLHRYRGGGKPQKWAALGFAIFEVPPAEIPALAEKIWAEDFSPKRAWIIQALIEHWSRYDLETALEAANQLTGQNQVMALRGLINPLLERDPARLEKLVLKRPKAQMLSFPFLDHLVKQNPRQAAQFVLEKMGNEDDFSVWRVASTWTRQDPEAALQWALSLTDERQRRESINGVVTTWSRLDREKALSAFLEVEAGSLRARTLGILMGQWARDDAEAAFDYLFEELPVEDRDGRLLKYMALELGGVDADQVIAAAKRIEDPELRGVFLGEAALRRLYDDARSLDVATLLPEGKYKDMIYEEVAHDLASQDMPEAIKWLESLSESSSRDAAIAAITPWLLNRDPLEAVRWAESITASARRKTALTNLAREWLRDDRAAATDWIKADEAFSSAEKTALLR